MRALRNLIAGLVGLILFGVAGTANAALVNFEFQGTLQSSIAGTTLDAGDSISATFTLDTLSPLTTATRYDESLKNVTVEMDGVTPTDFSGSPVNFTTVFGTTQITMSFNFDGAAAPFDGAGAGTIGRFQVTYLNSGLLLTSGVLSSLDVDLLTTLSPIQGDVFVFGGESSLVNFSVASVTPVPLPAALPLFLSALAGLGFVGWRRRQAGA